MYGMHKATLCFGDIHYCNLNCFISSTLIYIMTAGEPLIRSSMIRCQSISRGDVNVKIFV